MASPLVTLLACLAYGHASAATTEPTDLHAACPDVGACQELERKRGACEAAPRGPACGDFVDALSRALEPCDCSARMGQRCVTEIASTCVDEGDLFGVALETLANLEDDDAARLLTSPRLRAALTGEYGARFLPASLAAERRLRNLSRASSALPRSRVARYDAAQSTDGDDGTAWCEGVTWDGVGEWVEHRYEREPDDQAILGFRVVPGYGKSRGAWLRNGRATRLGVEPCGSPGLRVAFDLPDATPAEVDPWALVELGREVYLPAALQSRELACFRFTILRVARGMDRDTCLSELQPILGVRP